MTTDTRKAKRPAPTELSTNKKKPRLNEAVVTAVPAKPNFSSLISTQETDFPRGGGTSLTQVEVKEARAEAKDLFDASNANKKKRSASDAASTKESGAQGEKRKKFKNEKKKTKHAEVTAKPVNPDQNRVEHLNYKRLAEGTNVLAQIISIRPLELIVSLPNQLLAHIPITAISSYFTQSLASAGKDITSVDSDSEEEEDSDSDDADVPDLASMFSIGQLLNAQVTSTKTTDVARKTLLQSKKEDIQYRLSRRAALTLDPSICYAKMQKTDLVHGLILYNAVVKSIEDNGYVLDLAVEGVTAFLGFEQAKKANADRLLLLGQIIPCKVLKMSGNGRTCTISALPSDLQGSILTNPPSVDAILPMTLVSCLITALTPSGLNVKFLGFFDGTIDLYHLPLKTTLKNDLSQYYKIGQKVKARVLWSLNNSTSLNSTEKTIALTCLPHLVSAVTSPSAQNEIKAAFPIGMILQGVRISRVESDFGLVCEILGPAENDPSVPAFVHLSRVADEHLQSIPSSSIGGKWAVGTMHPARVIGFADVDGLVQLSLQPSVLEQRFLKVEDVKIGEIVKAGIKGLTDKALFLDIAGSVDGVVWANHFSDIKLKHPERKFTVGSPVKARIFSTEPEKFRVALTLKKSLVNSDLPVLQHIEEAKVGINHDAVVFKIFNKGLLVELFSGIKAFVPINEASTEFVRTLDEHFRVGDALRIRVLGVDLAKSQLLASIRQALTTGGQLVTPEPKTKKATKPLVPEIGLNNVEVGERYSATVTAIHKSNYLLALLPSSVKGLLSFKAIAKEKDITPDKAFSLYTINEKLENLVVVTKNEEKNIVIVGFHLRSASTQAKDTPMPTSISGGIAFNTISVGQQITGRISGRTTQGLNVQLARNLTGRVHLTDATDDYGLVDEEFLPVDSMVQCQIVNLDLDQKRVDLSLRASVMEPGSSLPAKDRLITGLDDLVVGQSTRGFVKNIAESGLFVSLGRDVTARVLIRELFDEFVQDWKSKFIPGQIVSGKILKIDPLRNQVELTLRQKSEPKSQMNTNNQLFIDFEVGQQVEAIIKKVETFGAFLRIKGTQISGLCHKSEIADDAGDEWATLVSQGAEVRAIITKLDTEKKRISFSMKSSLLVASESSNETGDSQDGSEDGEAEASSEEELEIFLGDEESESEVADSAPRPSVLQNTKSIVQPKALLVAQSFNWSGLSQPTSSEKQVEESDSEDEVDVEKQVKSTIINDRTGDMATDAPTSESEFERLLLGSANSSFLWIQYISFFMQQANLAKAREIAQRALQTISYREEEEKRNIWIAILNLETNSGTEQTLEDAFKNALLTNEPKHMYLSLCQILEAAEKHKEAEEIFERVVKKFSLSSKVWALYGQFLFDQKRPEDARSVLSRGLKSLSKRKHVKTITKFAQMEFRFGDAERGRTIFAGIVETHPKRLDLLSVYIDQEVKLGNMPAVNQLFERGLEKKLSSKKAKFLFKKWISIAKSEGDADAVEQVKARAAEYVNSQK